MDPSPTNNDVATGSPPQTLLARLSSPLREFGFAAGSLYILDQGLRRLSPQLGLFLYELMVQPITDRRLLPAGLSKNLTFRQIRRGDPEIQLMPARPDVKEIRFEQGAMCLGAYQRDTLIGYIWLSFGDYREDEVRCTYVLPADHPAVFDFDLYVMPEKRMGIGFLGVWHGANQHLQDRGIRYTFSRVTRFNTASRRSHARLGARRVGVAVFLKLWGLQLMVSAIRPYIHVSVRGRKAPRLILNPNSLLK